VQPILTPDQSNTLDRESQSRGITGDDLMEEAGRAVARMAVDLAGGVYGRRAVVVCGKGNNGGDGLVAARHLDRWGMGAIAILMSDPGELSGPAARNFRRLSEAGGRWTRYRPEALAREVERSDVAVDALFGTGFRGRPEGDHLKAIQVLNEALAMVVAVDIPSGVEGATGTVHEDAVWADVTVTMGATKPGLVFFPGAEHAGVVEVADIGFPPDLVRSDLLLVEPEDVRLLLQPREMESHKRASGVVLVVAGSRAMTGAAALVGAAAYRAGAGLVTLAVPEGILPVVEGAVVESTFLPLPETDEGTAEEGAWELVQERLGSVDAIAIGPGLTTNPSTAALVRRLVSESPVPFVLDADGLNAFAHDREELSRHRSEGLLTPHPGEFVRLTGAGGQDLAGDRVGHVRKAAREFGCTVLLKGSRTIVAHPGGRATVNPTGTPLLATAGTGDVLTGAAVALLARGLRPADAAMAAAYVHGLAGMVAGSELGEGTTAGAVLEALPRVLAEMMRG
jgi:hydroxyethylthiazole kinase-like uncharacterized protein yjeF